MAENTIRPAPPGTGTAGRRLWRGVLGNYQLAEHEIELLRQAVATLDLLDRLEQAASGADLLVTDRARMSRRCRSVDPTGDE